MGRRIEEVERQVLESGSTISAPQNFGDVARARGAIAGVFQKAAEDVAVQQAAERGTREGIEGTAGKNLIPGFGRAQQAYNNALVNTEARSAVLEFQKAAQNLYINASSPANFNLGTPRQFMKQMDDLKSGFQKNLRPEARNRSDLFMNEVQGNLENKMLGNAVQLQNKITMQNFQNDMVDLKSQLKTEIIREDSDPEMIKFLKEQLDQTIGDYSAMNAEIARAAPEIKKKMADDEKRDYLLKGLVNASADGNQGEYLLDFFRKGPGDGLSFDQFQLAAKEMLQQVHLQDSLLRDIRNETNADVTRRIQSGDIATEEQIMDISPELMSNTDKIRHITQLEKIQADFAKSNAELMRDMQNFAIGRGSLVSNKRLSGYFNDAIDDIQAAQGGEPVSLMQMANSMLGISQFPTSGQKGVSINTNVPEFDSIMSTQLTTKDNPEGVAEAAAVYNYLVKTQKSPNLLDLSGEALAVATKTQTLTRGATMTPEQAAASAQAQVMDKTDSERKAARDFYKSKVAKKVPNYFKDMFGVKPDAYVGDAASAVFKEIFQNQFEESTSVDAALNATRQAMAHWSTSDWAPKDWVQEFTLENEFPRLTSTGNAARNQQAMRLQEIIDRNPNIEWPKNVKPIELDKVTDEEKVFGVLAGPTEKTQKGVGYLQGGGGYQRTVTPNKIVVNGKESEVYLVTNAQSALSADGRVEYNLFYKDAYGELQQLMDMGSPTGSATWSPVEVDVFAPDADKKMSLKTIEKQIKSSRRNQIKAMKQSVSSNNKWLKLLGTDYIAYAMTEVLAEDGGLNSENLEKAIKRRRGIDDGDEQE